jgi:hypothetical protein
MCHRKRLNYDTSSLSGRRLRTTVVSGAQGQRNAEYDVPAEGAALLVVEVQEASRSFPSFRVGRALGNSMPGTALFYYSYF